MDKNNAQIEFISDPNEPIPEELEGFDQKIDDTFTINPNVAYKRQFTYPKERMYMDKALVSNFRGARRYRVHKDGKKA